MNQSIDEASVQAREVALERFAELVVGRETQLQQMLERFTTIAQIVGHDFGFAVSYGMPFGGNSFTPYPPHVVLDPARILLDPDEGEFTVEHEGAHRYNTYSMLHPGLEASLGSQFPIQELAQSLGFNAVFEGIEDPTVNRWLTTVYPGCQEKLKQVYDRQFTGDDAKLYTPEVKLTENLLGFYPKFGQFVSATIRKWHTGSWGNVVDTQVLRALEDTSDAVERIIPLTVEKTGAPESERQSACLKRYVHYITSVWPIVTKLVTDDIKEAGYQAFRQAVENSPGLSNQRTQAQPSGDQSHTPQLGGTSQNTEQDNYSQDAQPGTGESGQAEDAGRQQRQPTDAKDDSRESAWKANSADATVQRDLNGQPSSGQSASLDSQPDSAPLGGAGAGEIDDLIDSLPESLKDELRELLRALNGTKHSPPQLGEYNRNSNRSDYQGQGAQGDSTIDANTADEKLSPVSGNASGKPLQGRPSDDSTRASEDGFPGSQVAGQENSQKPISEEEDRALREYYRKIYPKQRGGFEERGLFSLKEFDDAINRHLRSKLNTFKVPTHQEAAAERDALRRAEERRVRDLASARDLETYRQSQLSRWDKSLEQGGGDLVRLVNNLRRILKPVSPERAGGFRSGIGLSLPHLMQDQARPVPTHQIFEQVSLPQSRDYFFQILADRSNSMNRNEKSSKNLAGVVLACEAFQRLNVPFELATFDTSFDMLKERTARLTSERKERIARSILHCSGETVDYLAIDAMRERAQVSRARFKVMFITTDGESSDEKMLLESIRRCGEQGIFLIGLGIGKDTKKVNTNYPNGRGLLTCDDSDDPNSFVSYFLETIRNIVTEPDKFRLFNS